MARRGGREDVVKYVILQQIKSQKSITKMLIY